MKMFVALTLALFSIQASASFLPVDIQEDLNITRQSDMTEAEYKSILSNVEQIYAPIAKMHGGRLSISGSWKSSTLNAGARQMFGFWQVDISGALARHPDLTRDGFTLIVCHELGHHLGGYAFAPSDSPLMGVWAASEGQSDYFATQACVRKLWSNETATNSEFRSTVSKVVRKTCDAAWNNSGEQELCYRALAATESMTKTMASILKLPAPPKIESPDQTEVAKTSARHPKTQCRMDTSVQGALCQATFDEKLIPGKKTSGGKFGVEAEREAAATSCMAYSNYNSGLRPACWFKAQL